MSSVRKLRAIVFDLDGLMFNTEDLFWHVGTELLRRRGSELSTELVDQMMGRRSPFALQMMIDHHQLDDTVEELQFESSAIFDDILDQQIRPMPGLIELIDALDHAGFPKAIATSSGRDYVLRCLSIFSLEPRFHVILTAEDVSRGKPDPEIYLTAAKRLQVEPSELMVLEDSEVGCRAAVAAGTFAVAVPGLHSRHHDFSSASLVVDNLLNRKIYESLELC